MTTQQFFKFCDGHIQEIKHILVKEENDQGEKNLWKRFDNCCAIPDTRERHRLVPIDENMV